jgi:hypothetical protein
MFKRLLEWLKEEKVTAASVYRQGPQHRESISGEMMKSERGGLVTGKFSTPPSRRKY